MSKTTERLIQVATELEDIVANFEETQKPDKEWKTEGWDTLLANIHEEGFNLWMFMRDDDPTTVLHEVYLAYKDTYEHITTLNQRIDALQAPNTLNQAIPQAVTTQLRDIELRQAIHAADAPPQFIRQNVNWDEIRNQVTQVDEWPALGAVRDRNVT